MIPQIPTITIKTRSVDIILEPIRMGKLKPFSDAVTPIITEVMGIFGDEKNEELDKSKIPELITKHYDEFCRIVSTVAPIEKAAIDQMFMDEFVDLVGGVIEINVDFFVKSLLPTFINRKNGLVKIMSSMNEASKKLGQMDTSHSSQTATV